MPARFPDRTVATAEAKLSSNAPPSCQILVQKAGGRAVWSLGSKYVLKDRFYYPCSEIEARNTEYAAQIIRNPFAKMIASWTEGDRYLTIQERLDGEPLEDVHSKLTQGDLARIGQQVGLYVLKLRTENFTEMRMLDGRPVIDRRLFKPAPGVSYAVCTTEKDVAMNLSLAIAGRIDHSLLQGFMAKMPPAMPFKFSHSDLHEGNIMVKDGNFVGLIDWELAGIYPSWWEFVNSCELLSDHLPAELQDQNALAWFRIYHALRELPSDDRLTATVNEYLSR
ncbi:kinase-like protein [Hypoxylon fragiforme]|uniref:kinase-like protein n=1 Tax=Hypoxylon fragiforme TaxID=63214 RepID=UPI0020C69F0D|nr:kinase-like protein [Hypoxylon fragiforme]KAI2610854.1 kinase-like protein [Hypoxylon fragiforme]